jgi:hypothetical protein
MPDIYRDPSDGAAARREHLLRHRRDELATLPHAIRRVVVARSARIGASLVVAVLGAGLVGLASWPDATRYLATHLPNHPAVLTAMLCAIWLGGVFAWWVARARCEHRFAVAMSRYVLPGANVDHDVERLDHEHVDEQARAMAQRLEIRSAALPVLASALVVPATAVYLGEVAAAGGVPVLSAVETGLADAAVPLALLGFAGAVAALLVNRPALRGRTSAILGLGMVPCLAIGAFDAAASGVMGVAWALIGAIAIAAPVGMVSWRLVRERVALDATDPTAGSEVITLRAVLRRVAAALRATARRLRATTRRTRVASTCGLVGVAALVGMMQTRHRATPAAAVTPPPLQQAAVRIPHDPDLYTLDRQSDGSVVVSVTPKNENVVVTPFDDMPVVPRGWRVSLTVTYSNGAVAVGAFGTDAVTPATFAATNCGEDQPLAFTLAQAITQSRFTVRARLEPASCRDIY